MMECPVCFEVFIVPLLLPGCGHTVCQQCAELLITEGNYLRCPECRLTYQLRRGIHSLPKNVALQRTIEEHQRNLLSSRGATCDTHPEDAASLYCKTCELLICLKCYFSNTLRKGESTHSGHQVDTSEDIFSKEKRLLNEVCKQAETKKKEEIGILTLLEKSEKYLKDVLEIKSKEIDKNKVDLIAAVKQTGSKLKFTLNGTVAKEVDYVAQHLESSRNRVEAVESATMNSYEILKRVSSDNPEINPLKEARKKLENLLSNLNTDQVNVSTLKDIEKFDTDVVSCFQDPKKALAFQTESPKPPYFDKESFIVSNTSLMAVVKYCQTVRVKNVSVFYSEAVHRGPSEKNWNKVEEINPTRGVCKIIVSPLERGTLYKIYAIALNEFGTSPPSSFVYFQTFDGEVNLREIEN